MRRILIYGDVNLNYRDGSAVWLTSLAECLVKTGSEVFLLLKADLKETQRLDDLIAHGVEILRPFDDKVSGFAGMTPRNAAQRIAILDRRFKFDVIISRGFDIASHLAVSGRFTNRMWPYLTEGPAFRYQRSERELELLDRIGDEARRVFVQTEEARSMLEALMPTSTGKTLLMHPIVPDEAFELGQDRPDTNDPSLSLSLVYAGKFARYWNTLEMCDLPEQLAEKGIEAYLHMIGDKFQMTNQDQEWLGAMQVESESYNRRITWYGGMQRRDVFANVRRFDVGICWRHEELDSSPEVSTKMLEYSALGTPPLLNRTSMHEQLLGSDYPLFVEDNDPTIPLLAVATDRRLLEKARQTARDMANHFSMSSTVARFQAYFERAEGHTERVRGGQKYKTPARVLLAGHDFKFASDLIESLAQRKDIEFRVDRWPRLAVHDKDASKALSEWADVVVCEWAGPNAVFYSTHLRVGQRLIIRFHGFEIRGSWLQDIEIDNVDAVVFVSDFYRKQVLRATGWPEHKTTVIYNAVDQYDLERPKEPGSMFRIGMAGYVPFLKRPDRAVELLDALLKVDQRYYLHIRGRAPWNYPWEWDKPIQQNAYRTLFATIAQNPLLSKHVVFEDFGPDMGSWFRRIGWVLSPSTRETFHLAPVEGMMSGAIPVVWNRTGADEIFSDAFIQDDTSTAAEFILENSDRDAYITLSEDAKKRASRYEIMEARSQWLNLILGENGELIELNGTSILDGVTVPSDTAETTALFYREAFQNGIRQGVEAIRAHQHLLTPGLADKLNTWQEMLSWVEEPYSVLAPPFLQPLYDPIPLTYLEIGQRIRRISGFRAIPTKAPKSVGNLRDDILIAADAFVRRSRLDRPRFLVGAGSVGVCFSALIAARRLGIPFYRGDIDFVTKRTFTDEVLEELRTLILQKSEDYRDIEFTKARLRERGLDFDGGMVHSNTVGLVADEFTSRVISQTVPTVTLDRHNWHQQLEGLDAVIIESAWEGLDRQWFHGVAYHGEDEARSLWELLDECKRRRLPTIFWNKEDPVHFRSFLKAAGRCDHIFTSDAGMLSKYISSEERRSVTVSSLSFFAQPQLHNPLPTDRMTENKIAFAGTYYGDRYKQRSNELKQILQSAADYGLKIYDRQHLHENSPYRFPQELQKYSVGGVSYSEMLDVYKAHPVHVNVNSVDDSPSMFSRRVVEIAASGSIVLSGRGRGVTETLGENFPVILTREDWHASFEEILGNKQSRLELTWNQMRTIFRSHRADQAVSLMLRTAGIAVNPTRLPQYGWYIDDPSQIALAIWQTVSPVVITNESHVKNKALEAGLATVSKEEIVAAGIEYVGLPLDNVSTTHCEDLLLVTFFASPDLLTPGISQNGNDPIISEGLGDIDRGLWSVDLESPVEAQYPYRCVLPGYVSE